MERSYPEIREEDLAVLVWIEPEALNRPQKRLLETITARNSTLPLALPIRSLRLSLSKAVLAEESTLQENILASSQNCPVIVPVPLAKSALGWTEFDITEEK